MRRFYVVLLCLFVFSFFVNAKLSVYAGSLLSSGAASNVSQAQKLDPNMGGKLFLPLFLVLLVFFAPRRRDVAPRFRTPQLQAPPFLSHAFDPDRFLRPPPSISRLA